MRCMNRHWHCARRPAIEAEPGVNAPDISFSAVVAPDGWRFDVPADTPLLQAAALAGIELPSACRNGTCRTCLCRLVSGAVTYRIEWPGLSAEEKAEGFILPCVAHAASDVVIEQPWAVPIALPP
jgi:ferredoxin